VIEELKKARHLKAVNEARLAQLEPTQTIVKLCQWLVSLIFRHLLEDNQTVFETLI